jgi:hypothetical protein
VRSLLAVLSAVAHGNGPNGLAIVMTALTAVARRMDAEHAAVYFQIIWKALREPLQRAMEKLVMEWQAEGKASFPPFAQQLIDRGKLEGKLEGKRDALLRLIARTGIALTDEHRSRIEACTDADTLDRWFDNVLGAKTAAEVLV